MLELMVCLQQVEGLEGSEDLILHFVIAGYIFNWKFHWADVYTSTRHDFWNK